MAKENSPFVGIAGTIGGISIAIIAILVIFSPSQAWVSVFIVLALVILGIFLGQQQKQVMLESKGKKR